MKRVCDMNIYDLLNEFDCRIIRGNKWMTCHDGKYIVMQRKKYAKTTLTLIETDNENDAISIFVGVGVNRQT